MLVAKRLESEFRVVGRLLRQALPSTPVSSLPHSLAFPPQRAQLLAVPAFLCYGSCFSLCLKCTSSPSLGEMSLLPGPLTGLPLPDPPGLGCPPPSLGGHNHTSSRKKKFSILLPQRLGQCPMHPCFLIESQQIWSNLRMSRHRPAGQRG